MSQLSSAHLKAFSETAKCLNFTKAAERLCITQSALTQRIQKLEIQLGSPVFFRGTREVRLTELGERLLQLCEKQHDLEQEFLLQSKESANTLQGVVRVAGFSSVMKSILLPQLSSFLRQHPLLQVELHSVPVSELSPLLERGIVDFVLTDKVIPKPSYDNQLLGYESYVLVQARNYKELTPEIFLDLNTDDRITRDYFAKQKSPPPPWRTRYLSTIELLIEGVKQGIGQAILPKHLLRHEPDLTEVPQCCPLKSPVYLSTIKRQHHSELYQTLHQVLTQMAFVDD